MADELKKFEVAAMVQEELERQMTDSFLVENAAPESVPDSAASQRRLRMTEVVGRVIAEALLREQGAVMELPAIMAMGAPMSDKGGNPKYEKTKSLLSQVDQLLYKLIDISRADAYNKVDDDVKDIIEKSYAPLVKFIIKKVYDLWWSAADELPFAKDNKKAEEDAKKDESVGIGLEVSAPTGRRYKVEELQGEKARVRDLLDKSESLVEVKVLRKWRDSGKTEGR